MARRRVEALLDGNTRRPLISIIAPAGSGKTTLGAVLAAREQRAGRRVRWLTSDDHADVAVALLAARGIEAPPTVRTGSAGWADSLDLLKSSEGLTDDFDDVVVVDDAHLLPRAATDLLHRALTQCPAAVRVVLLGRRDPMPPMVLLNMKGVITHVRGRQLLFEAAEARDVVLAHSPHSTQSDIDRLVEQTQGWASALVMGARSLAGSSHQPSTQLRLDLIEQPVLDYLLGDCLEAMNGPALDLLLACCQEDQVDAGLALALSGIDDAAPHLAALGDDGLVTAVTDDSSPGGVGWRLHPLLREALRRRTSPMGPDWHAVVRAHVTAARHYDSAGDAVKALRHAHRSGDGAMVASMLVKHGSLLVASPASSEVVAGLLCLSDEQRTSSPHLLAVEALLLRATGRLDLALLRAQQACEGPPPDDLSDDGPALAGAATIASVRLWRSMLGSDDHESAMGDARRLLRCSTSGAAHHHPGGVSLWLRRRS